MSPISIDPIQAGIALVAMIGWFFKLEADVKYLKKELAEHKLQSAESNAAFGIKLDAIQITVTSIEKSLAKIEGKLESKREE